jgi:hypothetical protein
MDACVKASQRWTNPAWKSCWCQKHQQDIAALEKKLTQFKHLQPGDRTIDTNGTMIWNTISEVHKVLQQQVKSH